MLTGCFLTSKTEAPRTDVSCTIYKKISYNCPEPVNDEQGNLLSCGDGGDTAQTVTEVREHNAVYDSICEE